MLVLTLAGFGVYHIYAVDIAAKEGKQEGLIIGWDIYEGTPTGREPIGSYKTYFTFNKSEITNATGVPYDHNHSSVELEYCIVIPYDNHGWKEPLLTEKNNFYGCCLQEGCSV